MGFRTVSINKRCKLEYSLNYLVYRGEEEKRIHLSEINTLIIQSTAVSITTSLLSELADRKIKVVFCDAKNNPQSELIPYYGCHNSSKRIMEQISWNDRDKSILWKEITMRKIENQAKVLQKYQLNEAYTKLMDYKDAVTEGDATNREGHAAKVYFNALFGNEFSRSQDILTNALLNYGYSIILSAFNREIISSGYLTQLGIHHKNEYNDFNLACDLMEPYRPLIDDYAKSGTLDESNFKSRLNNSLNMNVIVDNKNSTLENSIKIYVQSIFNFLQDNINNPICFFSSYELPVYETSVNV